MQNETGKSPTVAGPTLHPASNNQLFRPEVMAECQTQWLGTVLLKPTITHWVFATIALAAIMAIAALLCLTSFTRKARVNGLLVPEQGLMRVFAPQSGVITQLHIKEGTVVKKGEPLLALSTELQSEQLSGARQEVVSRLVRRRNSMVEDRDTQERLFDQQAEDLDQRAILLRAEQQHLQKERELLRVRLELSDKVTARLTAMRARDLITAPQLEEAQKERIDVAAKLHSVERGLASLTREEVEVGATLRALPLRLQTAIAEIDRNIALLEQELAEAEVRRQIVITAPQDGTVTAIQMELGGYANPAVPLLSIVPSGSVLQAHLLSPSGAIGFVRPGQKVMLRYEAFPYQKFGFYDGEVVHVSRSAVSSSEITKDLSGLTMLYGADQSVYRITVKLVSQTATAYGLPVPLQPGMRLEADVLIESRLLIEWVLDPLYTLSGKWHA